MSQPNNTSGATQYPIKVMRALLMIFGIIILVSVPLLGYFVGNFIGIHMSTGDIQQGYAYGGLLYTVYNATHNSVYYQESQVSQALGISEGQTDLNSLSMFGLTSGIVADFFIAFLLVREYEKMES